MAGAMILLFQAVPLPTSFETNLRSERRNSLVCQKKSQRKEKPVSVDEQLDVAEDGKEAKRGDTVNW